MDQTGPLATPPTLVMALPAIGTNATGPATGTGTRTIVPTLIEHLFSEMALGQAASQAVLRRTRDSF